MLTLETFLCPVLGLSSVSLLLCAQRGRASLKTLKGLILPGALIMGFYGYCIVIEGGVDLSRYYRQILQFHQMSLATILERDTEFLYTRDILFWAISWLGKPQLLAFVVGFTIYGISFYILYDQICRSGYIFSWFEILQLTVIVIGSISPFYVISTVRSSLSFVSISFAVYRDLVQKKINFITVALYIIPLGLHIAGLAVVILRLMQPFVKRFGFSVLAGAGLLSFFINYLYNYIYGFTMSNPLTQMFYSMVSKAYFYLNWNEGGYATEIESSLTNKIFRGYGILFIVLCVILFAVYNMVEKKEGMAKASGMFQIPMINYLFLIAVVTLGCLSMKTGGYDRFEWVFVLFSPVFFVRIMKKDNALLKNIFQIVFLSAVVMGVLNIIWHFRNLEGETITNFILFPGVQIVIEALKRL